MNRAGDVPFDEPLAYFLTWPTYGTWLPGDERGWVKRHHGFQLPDASKKLEAEARMTEDACQLHRDERRLVESTITEHCRIRNWVLHAVSCRTNHLQVVVTACKHPDEVREQLKAWCTRRLTDSASSRGRDDDSNRKIRTKWWADRGSSRYINDEDSLEAVISYVRDFQE